MKRTFRKRPVRRRPERSLPAATRARRPAGTGILRRRGRAPLFWFLFLALGSLVLYFPLRDQLASFLIRFAVARSGTVQRIYRGEAAILRHEVVLRAPLPGQVHLVAADGQLVRVGAPLLEVVNEDSHRAAQGQVAEREEELKTFEAGPGQKLKSLYRARQEAEGLALAAFTQLKKDLVAARFFPLDGEKPGEAVLATFWDKVNSLQEINAQITQLEKEREKLVKELEKSRELLKLATNTLQSPAAGLLSFQLDGLEDLFDPERDNQTASQLLGSEARPRALTEGQQVRGGERVAKVVDPDSFFLALPVPPEEARHFVTGRTVKVRWPELFPREVPARVVNAPAAGKGYSLVRLAVDQYVPPLVGRRKATLEVITEEFSGQVLPRQALVKKDDQFGVYVLTKTATLKFTPVKVVGDNGSQVAVEGLPEGTQVVANPFWGRDGQRLR